MKTDRAGRIGREEAELNKYLLPQHLVLRLMGVSGMQ